MQLFQERVGRVNAYKWYFFIQYAGDHYTLEQCLKILKTNHRALH